MRILVQFYQNYFFGNSVQWILFCWEYIINVPFAQFSDCAIFRKMLMHIAFFLKGRRAFLKARCSSSG